MTQNIRKKPMRTKIYSMIALFAIFNHAYADETSGTWKFEKSNDYFGKEKLLPAPETTIVQIVNGKLATSKTCFSSLKKKKYSFSIPFQLLVKKDQEEKTLIQYLEKKFSFQFPTENFFWVDDQDDCILPFENIFFSGDKLITVTGGSYFYSFKRTAGETTKPISANIQLYGYKVSQLPFIIENFINLCYSSIPKDKGMSKTTDNCSPVYYPHTLSKKDNNPLAQLIWNHDYLKGGAGHAEDYGNPYKNNLHPTFMILPPFKEVLIVRVDDFESGETRQDTMPGVYLTIKNGKVIEQINNSCEIDTEYFCVAGDGKKEYQLMDDGKFKKVK